MSKTASYFINGLNEKHAHTSRLRHSDPPTDSRTATEPTTLSNYPPPLSSSYDPPPSLRSSNNDETTPRGLTRSERTYIDELAVRAVSK